MIKIRKPNKRILILCEGETEYFYAKALQFELPRTIQRCIAVEIDFDSQNNPLQLAIEAKKRKIKAIRERNPYDAVWLFFDNDNWPQLREAFELMQYESMHYAYSSMCIEHWFILHFENCGKAFQKGADVLTYLKKLWPQYHKTKINHHEILKPMLIKAIGHAVTIRHNSPENLSLHLKNPYFTIDLLIAFFKDLESS